MLREQRYFHRLMGACRSSDSCKAIAGVVYITLQMWAMMEFIYLHNYNNLYTIYYIYPLPHTAYIDTTALRTLIASVTRMSIAYKHPLQPHRVDTQRSTCEDV